ncbi:MAG: metalloregulator ArsR/SmtB family transcription factor [Ferruginibacter sp.]
MKQIAADPFQAIADANRRQILNLLSKNSLTINSLAENFDMSRPAVSKHIKILCSAGFIFIEVKGRERYCKLQQEGFSELQDWMDHFDKFWNLKLDALGKFLSQASSRAKKINQLKRK